MSIDKDTEETQYLKANKGKSIFIRLILILFQSLKSSSCHFYLSQKFLDTLIKKTLTSNLAEMKGLN
jgi:hypothetical protein